MVISSLLVAWVCDWKTPLWRWLSFKWVLSPFFLFVFLQPSLLLDEMSRKTFAGIGANFSGTYNLQETELYQSRHRTISTPISTANSGNASRRHTSGIRSLSGAAMAAAAAAGAVAAASLEKPSAKIIKCVVHFLDNTQHSFEIDVSFFNLSIKKDSVSDSSGVFSFLQKRFKGQCLLDLVFRHLELVEKDYFGLQYSDPKTSLGHSFLSTQFFHLHTTNSAGQNSPHSSTSSRGELMVIFWVRA